MLSELQNLEIEISTEIYNNFIQGKVITKDIYDNKVHSVTLNKKYTYLLRHEKEFRLLYSLIGKSLKHNEKGSFFYMSNTLDGDIEEADKHALNIQTILLILGRYFEMTGRNSSCLGDEAMGFSNKDIEGMAENDEYNEILQAIGFESWDKAIDYLVYRGFAFTRNSGSYILSSAGIAFCSKIVEEYKKYKSV